MAHFVTISLKTKQNFKSNIRESLIDSSNQILVSTYFYKTFFKMKKHEKEYEILQVQKTPQKWFTARRTFFLIIFLLERQIDVKGL